MCDPRYILGLEKLLLGADRGSWKYLPLASAPHTSHRRPEAHGDIYPWPLLLTPLTRGRL
jgi:hypothetical protein